MPSTQYKSKYHYEIVTPRGRMGEGEASVIVFPATDGQFGILARHSPLVAAIGAGKMTISAPEADDQEYWISGGFAHVRPGRLTVLVEECTPGDALDVNAALAEVEQARGMSVETIEQREIMNRALAVATAKLRLAREYSMRRIVRTDAARPAAAPAVQRS